MRLNWMRRLLCAALLLGLLTAGAAEPATVSGMTETNYGMDYIPDDPWPFNITSGDREVPRIAITIDDCYDRNWVREIFQLCQSLGVRCTFYPVGDQLKQDALKPGDVELWREIAASDCEIGTHTHHHLSMESMTAYNVRLYVKYPQAVLDQVLGYHYPIQTVRPPFGAVGKTNAQVQNIRTNLNKVGYHHTVLWDVSQTNPDLAIDDVRNGSILLYHARHKDFVCLQQLIPQLLEKGFEMVTVTELLGIEKLPVSENVFTWNAKDWE